MYFFLLHKPLAVSFGGSVFRGVQGTESGRITDSGNPIVLRIFRQPEPEQRFTSGHCFSPLKRLQSIEQSRLQSGAQDRNQSHNIPGSSFLDSIRRPYQSLRAPILSDVEYSGETSPVLDHTCEASGTGGVGVPMILRRKRARLCQEKSPVKEIILEHYRDGGNDANNLASDNPASRMCLPGPSMGNDNPRV